MTTGNTEGVGRLASGPQQPINERKRFAILVLGSFGCIVCSFSYAWNLVANTLQDRYSFSQRDMSTIVTVGLVVQYAVLPYAFVYDYYGPLPIAAIATIYFPLGTLLLALCFMGKVHGTLFRLSVFNAMMASGCVILDLACCVTVLSYFPTNRGPVTALLKTFTGLGSALGACFYAGYFKSDPMRHFFFLFALSVSVGGLCVKYMRLPTYHLTQYEQSHLPIEEKQRRENTKAQYLRQKAPMRRFVFGFAVLFLLIVFLPAQGALSSYLSLGGVPKAFFAVVATLLTLSFLLVAAPLRYFESGEPDTMVTIMPISDGTTTTTTISSSSNSNSNSMTGSSEHAADGATAAPESRVAASVAASQPQREGNAEGGSADSSDVEVEAVVAGLPLKPLADVAGGKETLMEAGAAPEGESEIDFVAPAYPGTFMENVRTLELWALWWTLFTVSGTEIVIIFNATNILAALQGTDPSSALSTLLTVLNGVGSAVGRLLMSYFEVWSQKRKAEDRIPITLSLFFPTGSVILSAFLFLTLPAAALPLPYIVAAFGNGFCAATIILVTRTIFAQDAAKHYHFCFTANMVAALMFNRFLFGEWYTVQAEKQGHANHRCYGKHCVLMPLVVLMVLACSAFVTDVVLHLRYSRFCQRVLAERARGAVRAPATEVTVIDDGLSS